MYSFIHDEQELKNFFDTVVPPLADYEVYFLSLSCRKKYLSESERKTLHITRAEMFDRKIIRERQWHRFLRTVRKYETNAGSYLSKNGLAVPQHSLTLYFNINPSNSLKALKEFNQKVSDWQYELFVNGSSSFKEKFNKLDIEILNCYQRNHGVRHWMDIDFDVPKDFNAPEIMKSWLDTKGLRYYWVDTKSGYHLLIDRKTLTFNPQDIYKEGLQPLFRYWNNKAESDHSLYPIEEHGDEIWVGNLKCKNEIIINKNEMIPLPGCLQGGYPVRILKETT